MAQLDPSQAMGEQICQMLPTHSRACRLPASQQCARPVAEEEIKILSGVQEEFLPQLVPASPLPTFPRCGKPSRKLTHCLLLPWPGAGPCCLQHPRVAPFMDAGIAHCSDTPALAVLSQSPALC